ncbi:DUF3558 family protein [Actinokineospora sp. 24-640]
MALVGLTACGGPQDDLPLPTTTESTPTTLTAPPTINESLDVKPLLAVDPCDLVGSEIRGPLNVDVEGVEYTSDGLHVCRWEEDGMSGIGLGISVERENDPLEKNYDHPEAQVVEIDGFPAIAVAVQPDHVCDIAVKTSPNQGFSVIYGALDQTLDACGGARTVAEHLAGRVRES